MKKFLAAFSAFISALLTGIASVSAAGVSPSAGDDSNWWLYIVLALVAVALIIVLAVTGKKKK